MKGKIMTYKHIHAGQQQSDFMLASFGDVQYKHDVLPACCLLLVNVNIRAGKREWDRQNSSWRRKERKRGCVARGTCCLKFGTVCRVVLAGLGPFCSPSLQYAGRAREGKKNTKKRYAIT
jgi:hypothetical protein